ncbi:hypothetical protein C8A05DRAFT_48262 [Staphylotrichum tortipilum]|uniref:Uncharacterized protein n=1 Tax=Staphylotrichum tortipilum TaxID=2831512 RepID=A0AAN6M966_9PEZI|nr:hypothetical protein C8A05DRAFT_48262 [Staphylotrichum longicolle]
MFAITKSRAAQRQLGVLYTGTRTATVLATCPRRGVASVPVKDRDNMGGPGGQEHFPESSGLRRRYAMTTMCGVLAACSMLLGTRMAKMSADPNAHYVLVHDSSKGELDDVKYIKESELPKA